MTARIEGDQSNELLDSELPPDLVRRRRDRLPLSPLTYEEVAWREGIEAKLLAGYYVAGDRIDRSVTRGDVAVYVVLRDSVRVRLGMAPLGDR